MQLLLGAPIATLRPSRLEVGKGDRSRSATTEKPKKRYPGKIWCALGWNNYQGIHEHVSYHSFPTDKDLCKRWIHKLRRADSKNVDALCEARWSNSVVIPRNCWLKAALICHWFASYCLYACITTLLFIRTVCMLLSLTYITNHLTEYANMSWTYLNMAPVTFG